MSLHSLIDHPDKLLEFIHASLKPKDVEKKQFGEVFTPMPLVQEMLDKLPSHVWSNPALTWFDPAVGMGNFMIAVYLRLMDGLKDALPDPKERKRHILEKMLFMSELNQKNVFVCKQIFDVNVEYKTNIHQGDTLKLDIQKEWGVEGFDVVVGNPPYQAKQNNQGKRGGGDLLWNKFIVQSLQNFLLKNGFLVFINPSGWRKPPNNRSKFYTLYALMTKKNQMEYLSIHNALGGKKTFHCSTRYDWYVIRKIPTYTSTIIKDEQDKIHVIHLADWEFIPNYNFDILSRVLYDDNTERCEVIHSNSAYESRKPWMSKTENMIFKYPCIHSTPHTGTRYLYSKVNDRGHFGIPKIIFGDSGIYECVVDLKGTYGLTQHGIGLKIQDEQEGMNMKMALESKKFKDLMLSCSWSNFQIDCTFFRYLRKDFWKEFL